MKTFLVVVTTQYDSYEWQSKVLVNARTEKAAINKASKEDFTHDNGVEIQEVEYAQEIPQEEVPIVSKYIRNLYLD